MTMLWTWGCGRPCGPQRCSNEAATQRCGLTGENLVIPAFWMSSSALSFAVQARGQPACASCHSRSAFWIPGMAGLHCGFGDLAIAAGQFFGRFPDEAGDPALAGHAPQDGCSAL